MAPLLRQPRTEPGPPPAHPIAGRGFSAGTRSSTARSLRAVGWLLFTVCWLLPTMVASQDGDDDGTWGGNEPDPRAIADGSSQQPAGPPEEACAGGVVVDDGSTEIAYGWVPSVNRGRYVQEFHSRQFPTSDLDSVCVCFRRTASSGSDDTIDFRVVIYESEPAPGDDDFPAERIPVDEPRLSIAATGSGVPIGTNGEFFEIPVNGADLPTGTFYLGVEWDARADQFFFLCSDSSQQTEPVNAFFREDLFDSWSSAFKSNDGNFNDYKALMIRAVPNTEEVVDIPGLDHRGLAALVALLAAVALWRVGRP